MGRLIGSCRLLAVLCVSIFGLIEQASGGIHGLAPLLNKEAPGCCRERTLQSFHGKKLAIDASMAMYQFLIAVRAADRSGVEHALSNAAGEETSHIQGFFWRTIAMIRAGIKPVYVFDGKPPTLKSGELANRNMRRAHGEKKLREAEEAGDVEEQNKMSKRTVRVTREHAADCKRLLKLMGVPTVDAPSEAEAQCAELAKGGAVYAAATEDMDALCCGSPILVRRLTFSEARKQPILEYSLEEALSGLGVDMAQFVDLCILSGCDFSASIKGIGPKTALQGIKKHGCIEKLIASLNQTKHPLPEDGFPFEEVRELLSTPEVIACDKVLLDWQAQPDQDGLIAFLCGEKGFSEKRVKGGLEQLLKAKKQIPQARISNFFIKKTAPTPEPEKPASADGADSTGKNQTITSAAVKGKRGRGEAETGGAAVAQDAEPKKKKKDK